MRLILLYRILKFVIDRDFFSLEGDNKEFESQLGQQRSGSKEMSLFSLVKGSEVLLIMFIQ